MTLTTRFLTLFVLGSLGLLFSCHRPMTPPLQHSPAALSTAAHYGQVPLSFEANHGQAHEPVQFLARGTNATLYLMPTEAALEVKGRRNAQCGMKTTVQRRAQPNPHSPIRTPQSSR